ncbi:helix-turn-helix domain-containing protein [Streptomyces spectabilis]|nr:helix-turn-helix domain-containing protein [Streptomyces spectabilis]
MTLAQLGEKTGYSAAQVSRYERGIASMNDVDVRRNFADALELPHGVFGLLAPAPGPDIRHGQAIEATTALPRLPAPRVGRPGQEDSDDQVRRRKSLANLALTAAAAATTPLVPGRAAAAREALLGDALLAELRDAVLGLGHPVAVPSAQVLERDLARARTDFDACHHTGLSVASPADPGRPRSHRGHRQRCGCALRAPCPELPHDHPHAGEAR